MHIAFLFGENTNDLALFRQCLIEFYQFDPNNITVHSGSDLYGTLRNLFLNLPENVTHLCLYYSGKTGDSVNYESIVVANNKPLKDEHLMWMIVNCKNKHVRITVICDACTTQSILDLPYKYNPLVHKFKKEHRYARRFMDECPVYLALSSKGSGHGAYARALQLLFHTGKTSPTYGDWINAVTGNTPHMGFAQTSLFCVSRVDIFPSHIVEL